jgi:hypothetical protein
MGQLGDDGDENEVEEELEEGNSALRITVLESPRGLPEPSKSGAAGHPMTIHPSPQGPGR